MHQFLSHLKEMLLETLEQKNAICFFKPFEMFLSFFSSFSLTHVN